MIDGKQGQERYQQLLRPAKAFHTNYHHAIANQLEAWAEKHKKPQLLSTHELFEKGVTPDMVRESIEIVLAEGVGITDGIYDRLCQFRTSTLMATRPGNVIAELVRTCIEFMYPADTATQDVHDV